MISAIFCYYVLVTASMYWLSPWLMTLRSLYMATTTTNGSQTPIEFYLTLDATFYWLDNRHSLVGYVIYSLVILFVFCFAAYSNATKLITILSSIKYCSTLLHVISVSIDQLDRIPPTKTEHELKKIVRMHHIALRCVTLLERTLNPVMALQFVFCMLTWCLMLLYIVIVGFNVNVLNGMLVMSNLTLEMFGYCFLGTELATTGATIARQSYQFRWEQHSPDVRKTLQMIMMRSQKPLRLTAGGFISVNVEQFTMVVKTSYSILIVLKDVI
uniref:Uncharacterized protein n=1 Tax=Anopheles farauti TaxID=69004 RepID=A0A182PZQ0_9DIPT